MPSEVTIAMLASPRAHEVHHRLRAEGPVVWLPAIDGWFVTARDVAVAILRDAGTFTVDDERFSTAVVVGDSMLSHEGDEHARHRGPFAAAFSHGAVNRSFVEPTHNTTNRLVAGLSAAGSSELRSALAAPLAVAVIIDVLGLVGADHAEVLGWYRAIVSGVEQVTVGQAINAETASAMESLRECVALTSRDSGLLADAAQNLSLDELVANTAVLMFGAIETNEAMTANAIWHLLTEPGLKESVSDGRARIDGVVEESLRMEPAAAVVDRYATRDVQIGEARIAEGQLVRVSLAGANRDPATFVDPDRFDIDRTNARQHLAFVQGPHVCLGLHLARAQTAAALTALLDRLPTIGLDLEHSTAPAGLIFRKPDSLQAHW